MDSSEHLKDALFLWFLQDKYWRSQRVIVSVTDFMAFMYCSISLLKDKFSCNLTLSVFQHVQLPLHFSVSGWTFQEISHFRQKIIFYRSWEEGCLTGGSQIFITKRKGIFFRLSQYFSNFGNSGPLHRRSANTRTIIKKFPTPKNACKRIGETLYRWLKLP
jgi:hypothetical protein